MPPPCPRKNHETFETPLGICPSLTPSPVCWSAIQQQQQQDPEDSEEELFSDDEDSDPFVDLAD